MGTGRQYDEEFKKQALLLAKEIGNAAAAKELGIPKGTLGMWVHKAKAGEKDTGSGTRTPEESLNLAQQLQAANKRIKEQEKRIRELEKLNEFLEEASAFFAASRRSQCFSYIASKTQLKLLTYIVIKESGYFSMSAKLTMVLRT